MKTAIFIPARELSSRFPRKPMAKILGKSMIQRVWEIANAVSNADHTYITSDSNNIIEFCNSFGAKTVLTSAECQTGTDRTIEAYKKLGQDYDIIINLQGDAPLTPPKVIEKIIEDMQNSNAEITTPMIKLTGEPLAKFIQSKKNGSTTGTTVVFDNNLYALYFSKSVIPFHRNPKDMTEIYKHLGVYGYRPDTLFKLQQLPPSNLETKEQLEQLRALENGIPIKMVSVSLDHELWSVDSPEDIEIVEEIITKYNLD